MKIEKLTENKIRITLNTDDLKEKNVDFHSFMSNSLDSQTLFLDMLDEAEKEIGFVTKDYKIMIEAIAMTDGNFILTVTRMSQENEKEKNKKVKVKRKVANIENSLGIFEFNTFEDFCAFCGSVTSLNINNFKMAVEKDSLFTYNSNYYLVLKSVNLNSNLFFKDFFFKITEFSSFINYPELFERKLIEYGKVIIENDAIQTCIKYFTKR